MALRFKLDENMPGDAAVVLRAAGHEVHTVLDEALGGADDESVLAACRRESRILVTLDLDFGDIRTYPPSGHAGAWLLRPGTQTVDAILALIRSALAVAEVEPAVARLWTIGPGQLRIRD